MCTSPDGHLQATGHDARDRKQYRYHDGVDHDKVLAVLVRLLETSLARIGNEEYTRANGSYGLTTLRARHATVQGGSVTLVFRGKSGVEHRATLRDRRLARAIHRCKELPGQHLFQHETADGRRSPVSSGDVNDYLRAAAGIDVTAKDYRTWMGTLLAASPLAALPRPTSNADARRKVAARSRT
jgi:DNA topoisomerase I